MVQYTYHARWYEQNLHTFTNTLRLWGLRDLLSGLFPSQRDLWNRPNRLVGNIMALLSSSGLIHGHVQCPYFCQARVHEIEIWLAHGTNIFDVVKQLVH